MNEPQGACFHCEDTALQNLEYEKENQSLKAQIELLEKAVEFYADKGTWYETNWGSYIKVETGDVDSDNYAGKLARQTKQELEKMRKK